MYVKNVIKSLEVTVNSLNFVAVATFVATL